MAQTTDATLGPGADAVAAILPALCTFAPALAAHRGCLDVRTFSTA
jgi:hypothetical protein